MLDLDPQTPRWEDRYPSSHGLKHGPLVATSRHPRLLFHRKRTPACLGAEDEESPRLLVSLELPKSSTLGLSPRIFNFFG